MSTSGEAVRVILLVLIKGLVGLHGVVYWEIILPESSTCALAYGAAEHMLVARIDRESACKRAR